MMRSSDGVTDTSSSIGVSGWGKAAPVLAVYVAISLCGFVPIWIIAATSAPPTSAWVGVAVATVVAGARFAWVIGSGRRRIFEMCVWLFFYVFLGVAPLVQLRDQVDPSTTPDLPHDHDWTAVVIVLTAQVSYIAGNWWAARSRHRGNILPRGRIVDGHRTNVFLLALSALAVAYVGLVGPATLFLNRTERGQVTANVFGNDVLVTVLNAFVSVGLLVAIVARLEVERRRRVRSGQSRYLPVVLACIPLALIVNPIGSPRFTVLTVALGLFAAMGAYKSLARYRLTALVALGSMFLLFPVLDTFRRTLENTIEITDPLVSLKSGDFDGFSQIINTAAFVEVNGISWGNQILGVLLFFVPRSMWAEKPTDTGILLADFRGYAFTNLSAPLPAELYINGGWFALVLGSLVFGYVVYRLDARAELQLMRIGIPTVLGCVLPFYLIFAMRGSLLQATANLAVMLLTWFLVSRSADVSSQSRTGASGSASRKSK
ncbi:hypothetical protein RYJ27_01910 [Microbacterium limosum]|uniref:Oligosaccharide repeat unit polymerase n=1 Tax=Microbacterium limosum TaxID=3079935 RepID=A0AAU0MHD5_9MICO|nr:hypothetical protein [Microbacterium sp. Y20]WOQ70010.1 hypothetical protein RYJ27_01910 [Microbacterium sp. Y20]